MWDHWDMIGIMAAIHAVAMLLNYYRQFLEEAKEHPALQTIILIVTLLMHICSFPVLIVSYWISHLYLNRQEKQIRREESKKFFDEYFKWQKRIDALEEEKRSLSQDMREYGRKQGYKEGYSAAKKDTERIMDIERRQAYISGYADGQHDFPLGINYIEEVEN